MHGAPRCGAPVLSFPLVGSGGNKRCYASTAATTEANTLITAGMTPGPRLNELLSTLGGFLQLSPPSQVSCACNETAM